MSIKRFLFLWISLCESAYLCFSYSSLSLYILLSSDYRATYYFYLSFCSAFSTFSMIAISCVFLSSASRASPFILQISALSYYFKEKYFFSIDFISISSFEKLYFTLYCYIIYSLSKAISLSCFSFNFSKLT